VQLFVRAVAVPMLAILAMSPGCGGVGEGGVGSPGGDGSLFVRLGGMDGVRALVDGLAGVLTESPVGRLLPILIAARKATEKQATEKLTQ